MQDVWKSKVPGPDGLLSENFKWKGNSAKDPAGRFKMTWKESSDKDT
jgi:hypothetical protein